ncbi:P-loop containing nucleoside triphosphate hydrolase protein [Aspergillus leporis]|uniref:P-loop containing nucleoside triphosphate hydrolase protein n=1 Tax=Aspergillus leporis TaxID=41062 RepID=A0A5N5X666_9EURO|nr:P-loop containing nucleoside triphosphate hydrolase protein [Aspergillus leporis]
MSDKSSSLAYHRSIGSSSSSLVRFVSTARPDKSVDPDYPPDFSLGMRAEMQQLYRPDDRSPWNESVPASTATDGQAGSYAQECALIVRREPHPITNEVALHSITIQSPLIKKILDRTFQGFETPFHPFYYRWHLFEKLREDEQDEETQDHLDILYPIFRDEIMPHIEIMKDLTRNKVMSFDYLWTVFAPGMEVYTKLEGQDCLMELTDSRYDANMGGELFTLECRYIHCDGSRFVTSQALSTSTNLTATLSLEQLNGFRHMSYSGFYTSRSSRQIRKRRVENSRIIIDPHAFNIYGAPGPVDSAADDLLGGVHNVIYRATSQAFRRYRNAVKKHEMPREEDLSGSTKTLSPQQRLLCAPVVRGYCLTFRIWAVFYVENIYSIRWNETAFARLVLPDGRLMHGTPSSNASTGLGFIMLLSGEPGVGKTLEAESVAEEMRQPLCLISASELGETAVEVEESLEQVLELTSKWNAIFLLDECDRFLEARSTDDIRRNRLVSVFLRQLEYYRGIMFLTSNRISDFDPAFEVDIPSRLHVWKTFIQIGDMKTQLSDKDVETLATIEVNGREIKNIIKTARLLSKQEKTPLAVEHIEMVLRVKKGSFV